MDKKKKMAMTTRLSAQSTVESKNGAPSKPPTASAASATSTSQPRTSRRRKLPDSFEASSPRQKSSKARISAAADDDDDDQDEELEKPKKAGKAKPRARKEKKPKDEEKRLKRFRPKAPQQFTLIYDRATSQRFYILSRMRTGTDECPEEMIEMTGSTGNIYHIHISHLPTCTCPHSQKGNQCKHVIYVMSRVLRARYDLVYQLALLTSELREIFSNAPSIEISDDDSTKRQDDDKNRKELEGDCPICFSPFEGADDTVYCRAQCGQNMHEECFQMWAATKRRSAKDKVTCPMCRAPWEGDDDVVKKIRNTGIVEDEGYVNVANQLGISRVRGTN